MSRSLPLDDASTYVVELTPPGRGAVAVVLVAGPDAVRAVDRCFTPASGRPLCDAPIGRILLGRWGGADGEELVVCRRSVDRVEVHCHGGVAAVGAIIERLEREGCRATTWQDWLRAAEPDPIRAAAQIALADAPTARTAAILLDQLHGALSGAIRQAAAAIAGRRWQQAADALDALLAFRELGQHLTTPWQVVLAGLPNVGKSSLINALAGYQRAIVSHVPGTTRDVVTTTTAIDGWPVQLADTAGLRAAADELEAAGVALADAALARADLVLVVHDATEPVAGAAEMVARLPASIRIIHVRNKIDLLSMPRDLPAEPDVVSTSAVTGEGIAALVAAIGQALVPSAPAAGAAVPFTAAQLAALDAARSAMDRRDAAPAEAALQALLAR